MYGSAVSAQSCHLLQRQIRRRQNIFGIIHPHPDQILLKRHAKAVRIQMLEVGRTYTDLFRALSDIMLLRNGIFQLHSERLQFFPVRIGRLFRCSALAGRKQMVKKHREKRIHVFTCIPGRSKGGLPQNLTDQRGTAARIARRKGPVCDASQLPQPGILLSLKMEPVILILPIRIPVGVGRTGCKQNRMTRKNRVAFSVNFKFSAGPDQKENIIGKSLRPGHMKGSGMRGAAAALYGSIHLLPLLPFLLYPSPRHYPERTAESVSFFIL